MSFLLCILVLAAADVASANNNTTTAANATTTVTTILLTTTTNATAITNNATTAAATTTTLAPTTTNNATTAAAPTNNATTAAATSTAAAPTTTSSASTASATTTASPTTAGATTVVAPTTTGGPTTAAATTAAAPTTTASASTAAPTSNPNATVGPTTAAASTAAPTSNSNATVGPTTAPVAPTTTPTPDPCESKSCPSYSTCSVIGGTAECTCLSGYYLNNATCVRIAKKFKAEMKIQETYTAELTNKSSPRYQTLKTNVEAGLEASLKATQPAIEKVEVTGFGPGSVVAEYEIIITDAVAAENITASNIESAVQTAITTANFTGITVNTTYLPTVQPVEIVYGTTTAPSTAAPTTTVPATTISPDDIPHIISFKIPYPLGNCTRKLNATPTAFRDDLRTQVAAAAGTETGAMADFNVTCASIDLTFKLTSSSSANVATAMKSLKDKVEAGNMTVTIDGLTFTADQTSFTAVKDPAYVTIPTSTPAPTTSDDGLSDGAIAGIVVGAVVGVILIIVLVYCLCVKKKKNKKTSAVTPGSEVVELNENGQANDGVDI